MELAGTDKNGVLRLLKDFQILRIAKNRAWLRVPTPADAEKLYSLLARWMNK